MLVSVFAQFQPGSTFHIDDESEIVNAFFRARETGKYARLFVNYPFDADGVEPRCRALSDAISALQQARLLGRWNPDLVDYKIWPALKSSYDRFVEPKLGRAKPLIGELATDIGEKLHIAEPA